MGKCNIDHSLEDVKNKYESQRQVLPHEVSDKLQSFLQKNHEQTLLNEIFHLLKKYDLATLEERKIRDEKLMQLLKDK